MAEPITVKKKKLTIKSKAPKAAAVPVADGGEAAAPEGGPGAVNPFDKTPAVAVGKPPSYVFVGVLAILATLMFIAILVLQWTEFSFLQSAFPRPIQTGF